MCWRQRWDLLGWAFRLHAWLSVQRACTGVCVCVQEWRGCSPGRDISILTDWWTKLPSRLLVLVQSFHSLLPGWAAWSFQLILRRLFWSPQQSPLSSKHQQGLREQAGTRRCTQETAHHQFMRRCSSWCCFFSCLLTLSNTQGSTSAGTPGYLPHSCCCNLTAKWCKQQQAPRL